MQIAREKGEEVQDALLLSGASLHAYLLLPTPASISFGFLLSRLVPLGITTVSSFLLGTFLEGRTPRRHTAKCGAFSTHLLVKTDADSLS